MNIANIMLMFVGTVVVFVFIAHVIKKNKEVLYNLSNAIALSGNDKGKL